MNRSTRNLLTGILLTLFCSTTLFAQSNLRATVFGGVSLLGAERIFIVDDDPFQSEFDNGGKFGFRFTADLDDSWSVEGSYGFSNNDLRITELDEAPPRERRFDLSVHQFIGNLLYYFSSPGEDLRPFATAGIGFSRFSPSDAAQLLAALDRFADGPAVIQSSTQFNFNLGGGIEARAWDWLGVRVDLRDHMTGMPRLGLPKEPRPGPFFPVEGVIHNTEISAGAVIYLD